MASKPFRFQFDPNQDFQLEAIQSIVDLFEGLPRFNSEFALGDEVVANLPPLEFLDESVLHQNLSLIQERNRIPRNQLLGELAVDEGMVLEAAGNETWRFPNFTVEMETGTGKTYVYLRAIHELRQRFGFRKFVIVVPSIAIFEGVVKSFQVTRSHFASLYHNETVNLIRYDGSRLSQLRAFASSTFVEILVMTLASFNSAKNTIFKPSEALPGERLPFQFIQETRPILILDEPQNMESDRSREALRTLHPLFALRFSATHRTSPNLVYRLTPFEAYRRNLVKKIQVDGVTTREDLNQVQLLLEGVARTEGRIEARVRTLINERGRAREGTVVLRQRDRLSDKTGRPEHEGLVVHEIHLGERFLEFDNGDRLRLHERSGAGKGDIFRVQIERTIREHMLRQQQLLPLGIKVLSLFFIDRVANYVADDGIIRRIFDQEFERLKADFEWHAQFTAQAVREAYFAKRKVKGSDELVEIDTPIADDDEKKRKDDLEAEKVAFELIMRRKEQLLSLDEPVSFVFAHSALKEGWDNPNVFQICTLNHTVSEMKKRQEIGRGLRLAVNQEGERVFDEDVNVLTVVANESYDDYVSRLQTEYEAEEQEAPPKPTPAKRASARRNEALFTSDHFRRFWRRLSRRARYDIQIDTEALVKRCVESLTNDRTSLRPVIVVERGTFDTEEYKLTLLDVTGKGARIRVERNSTDGQMATFDQPYKLGADLARVHKDDRLRGFKIRDIQPGEAPVVTFANGETLRLNQPLVRHFQVGKARVDRTQFTPESAYPVPNLLERVSRETNLTRATVARIFSALPDRKKSMVLANPEGFAGWFASIVRGALADHLVANLRFVAVDDVTQHDLDELFPEEREFPQQELMTAGERALYDQVQVDSSVESHFVEAALKPDTQVLCFFKFPPKFKVDLPDLLGNYNPDWGILRRSEDNRVVLELVRETKGQDEFHLDQLRFPHEERKVRAAQRYFEALGIDYRVVTDETPAWWRPSEHEQQTAADFEA